MKKLIKYLKGNLISTFLAPLFIIIDTLGMIVQPYYIAKIIDIGIANGDKNYIVKTGIIMVALSVISLVGGYLAMFFSSRAAYGFGENLRRDLLSKIQEFSFSNINKFSTTSLIIRLTNDVEILVQLVQMMLRMFIRAPFMLLGGVIMTLTINHKLSVVFLGIIPIIFLLIAFIIKKVFPLFKGVQIRIDKVNSVIRESLVGARVIKSFVREDFEMNRFDKANVDLKDTIIKSFSLLILLMPTVMLIMNLAVAAILFIGGNLAGTGEIDIGSISASITYITITLMSLIMLSMVFMNFSRAKAASDRILEVLDEEPDIISKKDSTKLIEKGEVEYNVEKIAFKDSDGEAILENIKFNVKPGQTVAIIGSTGTGKSTLVNLMPRFYDVTSGYVKIDGIDVREYDIKNLRDGIGMVLQDNILFSGTIEENIRWGKADASIEEIKHACKIAQIDEYIETLPERYNSIVEQRGVNFSGGQKQRLAIARALIKKPKILILDDSVSALDSTTEINLRKALNEEFKDTTIFLIVQKINSCKDADKVIVIDDGTVVGEGTHEELIKNNKVYQEISESQKEVMSEQ